MVGEVWRGLLKPSAASWNSSDEYSIDGLGNRVQRVYENEEQKTIYKQRKTIQKIKSNIGQFFKENTIGDLLPNNQKLIVLNHEVTISQTIEAMIR